jgi:AcrR family transcriptional regulator
MSTPHPPSTDDAGSAAQRERRRRILDATIDCGSQGGFEAVQMRAVAERAEVALGTLYRYFPSKIHLLVSALARELERADRDLEQRTVAGDTPHERVMSVLDRATRTLQRDPHLTEALTRAFVFADASVAAEINVVEHHVGRLLMRAMADPLTSDAPATEDSRAIAKVIGDVWLASLVQWVTGRSSASDVGRSLDVAVRLLLR